MHDTSLVRKRRRRGTMDETLSLAGRWGDTVAMALFFGLCVFAVFSPGAPVQLSHGVLFAVAGALLMAFPPRVILPRSWYCIAAAFLILSSLCFLPAAWGGAQPWRAELSSLGLDTGSMVTPHPQQSFEQVASLIITVVVGLSVLSRRISGGTARVLALLFPVGVAAYALVSILSHEGGWKLAWDSQPGFGFFPNRNHTATLLAMGTVTGVAVMFQSVRARHSGSAGLAALAVVLCLWALGGYNLSRAGLLLAVSGLLGWVAFLGRDWISRRVLVVVVVFAAAGGGLFWLADTGLKSRIKMPGTAVTEAHSGADDVSRTATSEGEALDFRVLIYKDTLSMIGHAPWTGPGPGMFRFVFPQYQWFSSTANNSRSVHPESDWLMVAAESGLPAMLLLAAGVGLTFMTALKGSLGKSTWPVRLGCLIAAAVVPLHGMIDVPGHRIGLVWSAVFLLALVLRDREAPPAAGVARLLWRSAGAAILLAGGWMLRAEWFHGPQMAEVKAGQLATAARELFALDQEEQRKLAAGEPAAPVPEGEDRLEKAITLVDEALALTPLDPELHFLKGSLALFFTDKESIADRSFAIQRRLDPAWVRLPLRQAKNWLEIDPKKAAALWAEAMERSARLETLARGTFTNRGQVFYEIMTQAEKSPPLSALAADCIGTDTGRLMTWINRADIKALNAGAPALLERQEAAALKPLVDAWMSRDSGAAKQWSASRTVP